MANDLKISKTVLLEGEPYLGATRVDNPIIGGGDGAGTEKYISVFDRVAEGIADGNIGVSVGGNLTLTEEVTSPADTSGALTRKAVSASITTTAASTAVIPVNVPVGAKLVGAQFIVTTAIAYTGDSTAFQATWTASTQNIGGATTGAKNDKDKELYSENANEAKVSGSVETITLTANNTGGFAAGGVVLAVAWYDELIDLTDVA